MYNEYDDEKNMSGNGMNGDAGTDSNSYDHTSAAADTDRTEQESVSQFERILFLRRAFTA